MSSHERGPTNGDAGHRLPGVPVDLPSAESMSWELGQRLLGEGVPRLVTAENDRFGGSLTAFDVAEHTCLLRVRTPVGRESFYGTTKAALRRGVAALEAHEHWTLREE